MSIRTRIHPHPDRRSPVRGIEIQRERTDLTRCDGLHRECLRRASRVAVHRTFDPCFTEKNLGLLSECKRRKQDGQYTKVQCDMKTKLCKDVQKIRRHGGGTTFLTRGRLPVNSSITRRPQSYMKSTEVHGRHTLGHMCNAPVVHGDLCLMSQFLGEEIFPEQVEDQEIHCEVARKLVCSDLILQNLEEAWRVDLRFRIELQMIKAARHASLRFGHTISSTSQASHAKP
jgi:hypothetical protein